MWSGPRNISTTMMRSFGNRPDTAAIDEPFYANYLSRTGADHPYKKETLAAYPAEWGAVIDWINAPLKGEEEILFLKHIAYHLPDDADLSFILKHRNFLLIREPRAMVASFSGKFDDVSPIVRSFEVELRIFEFLAARGIPCPVVDAADIVRAPEAMLRALCAALAIPFDAAMLSWPAGPRREDGPWAAHWYDAVRASTGFKPQAERRPALSPDLEAVADLAMDAYRRLFAQRLAS